MNAKQHILHIDTPMRGELDTIWENAYELLAQIEEFEKRYSGKKWGPQYKHMPNGVRMALDRIQDEMLPALDDIDDCLENIDALEG